MTIAAAYLRKSTDQAGVSEDQCSVARQFEHARAYAEKKGWRLCEEFVFADDGISGAEFTNRPGFLRLMNALKPRPGVRGADHVGRVAPSAASSSKSGTR